ncbi:MAG: TonB-dependent receptor, partial [Bacteroidota bacterium]
VWDNFRSTNGHDSFLEDGFVDVRGPGPVIDRINLRNIVLDNNDVNDLSEEQQAAYFFKDINASDRNAMRIWGLTLQDQLVYDRLRATVGFRYSRGQSTNSVIEAFRTEDATERRDGFQAFDGLTSNFGLFYDLGANRNSTLFASYSNTFDESSVSAARIDFEGNIIPNEIIDQGEIGIRNVFFNGRLSANVTLYRIVNNDVAYLAEDENGNPLVSSVTQNEYFIQGGDETRSGIELLLQGKVSREFRLSGSYSYFHFNFQLPDDPLSRAIVLPGNPAHSGNIWGSYSVKKGKLKGLVVGSGLQYVGDRLVYNSNDFSLENPDEPLRSTLPDYLKWDAFMSYDFDPVSVTFKLNNITNQLTFDAFRTAFININPPRNFELRVNFKL